MGSEAIPSFDPGFFASLFPVEDKHFWFRARNRVVATVMAQVVADLPPGYRVLEVGCGTGNVLSVLERVCEGGRVVGMDLFAEGLHFARRRVACALVQGDIHAPPFGIRHDVIGLFDVIEHLPDDARILRDVQAMLVPDGIVVLTVPAHQALWSYADEAACHCRRYSTRGLREALVGAGFRIEYLSQYMATLFPLMWAGRRLAAVINAARGRVANSAVLTADEFRILPVVNEILTFVLNREADIIARRWRLPVGTSIIAIARKT